MVPLGKATDINISNMQTPRSFTIIFLKNVVREGTFSLAGSLRKANGKFVTKI